MKTNDSSKKLIKNVVSLATSALILIAATFAWFAVGHETSVGQMKTKMDAVFSVEYAKANLDADDVLLGLSDGGDFSIRKADTSVVPFKTFVEDIDSVSSKWTSVGSELNNDVLIPGEFQVYRISFTAIETKTYKVQLYAAADNLADTDVSNSVFVGGYMTAQKSGTVTKQALVQKTLTEAFEGASTDSTGSLVGRAMSLSVDAGESVTAYYVVGIPGEDINATHDAIRATGATIGIKSIEIG